MMQIFDIIAIPLGYVLWFIYKYIGNYFISIFLFTLLIRAATFPLSLKSQKANAERARLTPRLERLQKKYAQDKQKLQQKQMELYEKEGVSMTGGCLPMVIQMIVLFGVISVIYMPLTHLAHIPAAVTNAAITKTVEIGDMTEQDTKGYYKELYMLKALDKNEAAITAAIAEIGEEKLEGKSAAEYVDQMKTIADDFRFGNTTMLDNPWNSEGIKGINLLWIIPLLSWLTAMGSSLISMYFTKQGTAKGEKQPGQGCSNVMLVILMPLFSLYITFIVPGGVGIYWICSNLIAILQTIILNMIYNPAKIRAKAEAEYEERRRKKAEDKKRLAEARRKEEEERVQAEKAEREEAQAKEKARLEAAKKPKAPSKNPNKIKRREANAGETADEQENLTLPSEETMEDSVPAEEPAEKTEE
ncbi:MAG: membrane protein insertase YidC [Clostridiales bacterium]|nr:membrane protein insertase YidC [Clostridiales bacterium]